MIKSINSRHYGVTISCELESYPGCCGANIMKRFSASGNVAKLTMGQKHEMYKEMFRQIISTCSGVLVATDAVVHFGPWANLERSTSNWNKSDSAGDISLEDFCEHFGFAKSGVAKNRNSGNLVASYTMAIHPAHEEDPGKSTTLEIPKPDFSDEPRPEKTADSDLDSVIAQINALLEEA